MKARCSQILFWRVRVFASCAALAGLAQGEGPEGRHRQVFAFAAPEVTAEGGLTQVQAAGCINDAPSGHPLLPVKGVSIMLPKDIEIVSVTVTPRAPYEIPLAHPVAHAQQPRVPGEQPAHVPPDAGVYQRDEAHPAFTGQSWRTDKAEGGTLLSLRLSPVRYNPVRGVLLAADALAVEVAWRAAAGAAALNVVSPLEPGTFTYLVIAHPSLLADPPPAWGLDDLCAVREREGFTTKIVATDWIYANYGGPNPPAQIRAFMQDAHAQWGVQYLLLVGTFNLLPAQKLRVTVTESGGPRVGDIPADAIYYGCLNGSFDGNGNGIYGERTDGDDGRDVDLAAHVMVGRFPVDTPGKLAHAVRKTLRHKHAAPAELAPAAFIAERVDFGSTAYATGFMEEIRLGSTAYGMTTLGFANALTTHPFDTSRTLYDGPALAWTAADALAFLNRDYAAVSHLGHASETTCFKIPFALAPNQNALSAFTNATPYLLYSQGCSSGAFDTPNCVAEQFLTATNAAFAAVMNARDGFEFSGAVGGYSHYFHRAFTDAALRATHTRLGDINEASRRQSLP
ncbi:MAG: C25 family cysteine peptidase, partial [Kiritimatiellaeota bacterium]|nr:C25 family cysteine peptidase [Kiritimatiellota bacterium]